MLTAPESNVTLTDAQTAAIEESKNILLNLETEITRASRTLNGIKNQIITANEEKDYISTQVDEISRAKDSSQKELDAVNEQLITTTKALEKTKSDTDALISTGLSKMTELAVREQKVSDLETTLAIQKDANEAEQKDIASERAEVNAAKEAFRTAITAVTWK